MNPTFIVTLNWNTTGYFQKLLASIEATTPEEHVWVIVDNGSNADERTALRYTLRSTFGDYTLLADPDGVEALDTPAYLLELPENLGCVLGHNAAFAICQHLGGGMHLGRPYDVVMVDTDVEVYHQGWLSEVNQFVRVRSANNEQVGIVGLEHSEAEICAPSVALDPHGYWYIHPEQPLRAGPVRAESVGLGFALLKSPVPELRFDTGYELYYKQDDDLCFTVRSELLRDVWAYPVSCIHWGSRALRENNYQVGRADGYDEFDKIKRQNQAYFARKWAWALRPRRPSLHAEQIHLERMRRLFASRKPVF